MSDWLTKPVIDHGLVSVPSPVTTTDTPVSPFRADSMVAGVALYAKLTAVVCSIPVASVMVKLKVPEVAKLKRVTTSLVRV